MEKLLLVLQILTVHGHCTYNNNVVFLCFVVVSLLDIEIEG